MSNLKISQFSTRTAPATTDILTLETGNANYQVEASLVMGLGLSGMSGMRLSSSSTLSVPTADALVTNLYLNAHFSNYIIVPDSNGTWKLRTTSNLSLAVSGLSAGGLNNYDVFVWDNAGALTLAFGTAWTNDTTRANALTTVNGVYVNSVTEGSMPANKGLHLGILRNSNSTTYSDKEAARSLTNRYNRVNRKISANPAYTNTNADTTNTTTATTWAVFGSGTIDFLALAGDSINVVGTSYATHTTAAQTKLGIAIASPTNANSAIVNAGLFKASCPVTVFFKDYTSDGFCELGLRRFGVTSTATWLEDMLRNGTASDVLVSKIEGLILA